MNPTYPIRTAWQLAAAGLFLQVVYLLVLIDFQEWIALCFSGLGGVLALAGVLFAIGAPPKAPGGKILSLIVNTAIAAIAAITFLLAM